MDKLYSVETKTIAKKKLTTKPRRKDNGTQRVDVTLEEDGTKKLAMMSMNGQVVTKKVVVGYSEYKFIPGVEGVTFPPGEFIPGVLVEAMEAEEFAKKVVHATDTLETVDAVDTLGNLTTYMYDF